MKNVIVKYVGVPLVGTPITKTPKIQINQICKNQNHTQYRAPTRGAPTGEILCEILLDDLNQILQINTLKMYPKTIGIIFIENYGKGIFMNILLEMKNDILKY